jgi:hypothetical protein
MVWISLIGLFALLLYLALRVVVRRRDHHGLVEDTGHDRTEADRIEELPFPVARSVRNLLAEAKRHYEAGSFAQAIVYLYSYELVELDKANLIRLEKGKTNRQYLGDLLANPDLRRLLSRTMRAFEDVFFGRYDLSRDRFETCWNDLAPFHRLVQGTEPAS